MSVLGNLCHGHEERYSESGEFMFEGGADQCTCCKTIWHHSKVLLPEVWTNWKGICKGTIHYHAICELHLTLSLDYWRFFSWAGEFSAQLSVFTVAKLRSFFVSNILFREMKLDLMKTVEVKSSNNFEWSIGYWLLCAYNFSSILQHNTFVTRRHYCAVFVWCCYHHEFCGVSCSVILLAVSSSSWSGTECHLWNVVSVCSF